MENFKRLGTRLEKVLKFSLVVLISIYRSILSAWFGGACRMQPSCSEYAVQALSKKSLPIAIKLILNRIYRCRPGGSFGYDPIPENNRGNQ